MYSGRKPMPWDQRGRACRNGVSIPGWLPQGNICGFTSALRVLQTPAGGWRLACWNHRKQMGWVLYVRQPNRNKMKWMAEAGADSISWDVEPLLAWANSKMGVAGPF
jgi:hypothetical protein